MNSHMLNNYNLPYNQKRTVVLRDLEWNYRSELWTTSAKRRKWAAFKNENLNNDTERFQIKDSLTVKINPTGPLFDDNYDFEKDEQITSKLLQGIHCCNIQYLDLYDQTITFNEYLKLTASKKIKMLYLDLVRICKDDGTIAPLEDILAQTPDLYRMNIQSCFEGIFTAETAQKLVEFKFEKLWIFELHGIREPFNIDDFCKFILKQKTQSMQYYLHLKFDDNYELQFHIAMNKIIEEWDKEKNASLVIMINGLEYPFDVTPAPQEPESVVLKFQSLKQQRQPENGPNTPPKPQPTNSIVQTLSQQQQPEMLPNNPIHHLHGQPQHLQHQQIPQTPVIQPQPHEPATANSQVLPRQPKTLPNNPFQHLPGEHLQHYFPPMPPMYRPPLYPTALPQFHQSKIPFQQQQPQFYHQQHVYPMGFNASLPAMNYNHQYYPQYYYPNNYFFPRPY